MRAPICAASRLTQAVVVAAAAGTLALLPAESASAVGTQPPRPARGIDVSSFQHPGGAAIRWRAVARAGYRFAFIKSTEGNYYVNPYFATDAAAAKAAGLLVAAYHFANPAASGGKAEADYALNHGGYVADGRTLTMILDIEPDPYLTKFCYGLSKPQMVQWIASFMTEAHRRTTLWPVINTQPAWWNTCTGGTRAFTADHLWVQYPTTHSTPTLPRGWRRWAYWQYSITGRVAGVTGNTDLNELKPSVLAVADPGDQTSQVGDQVRVPVRSVNAAAGQTLSYTAAGLPAGLTLNPATGVVSGTPVGPAGSTTVSIRIAAAGAAPVTWHFTWHVTASKS